MAFLETPPGVDLQSLIGSRVEVRFTLLGRLRMRALLIAWNLRGRELDQEHILRTMIPFVRLRLRG